MGLSRGSAPASESPSQLPDLSQTAKTGERSALGGKSAGTKLRPKGSAAHSRSATVQLPLVPTYPETHLSKVREKPHATVRKLHRLQMERAMTLVSRQAYLRMLRDGSREKSKCAIVSSLRRILILYLLLNFPVNKNKNTLLRHYVLIISYQITSAESL